MCLSVGKQNYVNTDIAIPLVIDVIFSLIIR